MPTQARPCVTSAPDPATPVQERGAEPAEAARPRPGQQRLAELAGEIQRTELQLKALPVRELAALDELDNRRETTQARRAQQLAELEAMPKPGRLRDPLANERASLQMLVASSTDHLAALQSQRQAREAKLAEQHGRNPVAVRAEHRGLTERHGQLVAEHRSEREQLVSAALASPPAWVERDIGPRPDDASRDLGAWKRAVRDGVRAQLDADPTADLHQGLPDQAPAHARKQWSRARQSIDIAARRSGRASSIDRGHDRDRGLDLGE